MEHKTLGEICDVVSGGTPSRSKQEYWNGDIPWIKIGNIKSKYVSEADEFITEAGLSGSSAKMLKKGTILYTIFATLGEAGVLTIDACTNQAIAGISIKDESVIDRDYLFYYLKSKKNYVNEVGRGVAQNNINMSILRGFEVPIRKLYEQQEITKILDKTASIIEERKKELDKLDGLIKARFVEMFGHPGKNEKGWKMNTFGDICTVRQGLQIPISKRLTEYEEGCYEYITVQYLHGGKEREYIKNPKETVICNKDDILMTRTGNTGMVITGVDGVFHNNFFLIDFDRSKYDKDFLVQYLNLDMIQADILRRAGTSTIPDLNHGEFYKIQVFEPPMALQVEFNYVLKQVDKSKVVVQKALDETQTLFDSLMQEYFG